MCLDVREREREGERESEAERERERIGREMIRQSEINKNKKIYFSHKFGFLCLIKLYPPKSERDEICVFHCSNNLT